MVLPQNLFWLGRPYALNPQKNEPLAMFDWVDFVVLMVLPQNLFWRGRPYALNPQENEPLAMFDWVDFVVLMVLPRKQSERLGRPYAGIPQLADFPHH